MCNDCLSCSLVGLGITVIVNEEDKWFEETQLLNHFESQKLLINPFYKSLLKCFF